MKLSSVLFSLCLLPLVLFAGWNSPPPQILSDQTGQNSSNVVLTQNNAGQAIAVWENTTTHTIQASFFDGTNWNFQGDISPVGNNSSAPQVSMNDAGHALAVWQNASLAAHAQIQAAFFNGTSWGSPMTLTSTNTNTSPQVKINSSDEGLATWTVNTNAAFPAVDTRLDSSFFSGGSFGASVPVDTLNSTSPNTIDASVLGFNDAGTGVVAYTKTVGGVRQVYSSTFQSGIWSAPTQVSTSGSALGVQISVNALGHAMAVWTFQTGLSSGQIQAAFYNGTTWGSVTNLTPNDPFTESPQVSLNDSDHAFAIWDTAPVFNDTVQVKFFNGTTWDTSPTTLYDVSGFDGTSSQIDLNNSNQAVASWTIFNESDSSQIIAVTTFNGTAWDSTITQLTVADPAFPAEFSKVQINGSGVAIAAWDAVYDAGPNHSIQAASGTNLFGPAAPAGISSSSFTNRFPVESEFVKVIKWQASSSSGVLYYNIYRNGTLIGTVAALAPLVFQDHDRNKNIPDTYEVAAVTASGQGAVITITF